MSTLSSVISCLHGLLFVRQFVHSLFGCVALSPGHTLSRTRSLCNPERTFYCDMVRRRMQKGIMENYSFFYDKSRRILAGERVCP